MQSSIAKFALGVINWIRMILHFDLVTKLRHRRVTRFVEQINTFRNPFVYKLLSNKNNFPDIDVFIPPQYSQRGEDLIVEAIINAIFLDDPRRAGKIRYLEIGANHPIASSSTFLFYSKGARGVLVEANPNLIPQLAGIRRDDVVINAAVVASELTSATLYISNKSELSSTRRDFISSFPGATVIDEISVPTIHIGDLIKDYWQDDFVNILVIDVEGQDYELLESSDLARYQFDIIQIEPSDHLIAGNRLRIWKHLNQLGYQLVADTQVNMIFSLQQRRNSTHSGNGVFKGFGEVITRGSYKSFDVFDTLIARRKVSPESIFEELKLEFGELIDKRVEADNGARSLREIYEFCGLDESILNRELELERAHCIPIQENIEKVQDGDLLVSDTYLPREFVSDLLSRCGLTKDVGLSVSNSDKRSGVFWSELKNRPALHLGDNEVSDFDNPKRFGVRAELATVSTPTHIENELNCLCSPLGYFVRECRLSTSCSPIQRLAVETNIPMLLMSCVSIAKLGRKPIFLGRDCQTLSEIYCRHFGECSYLPFSRMFARNVSTARQYLMANTAKDDIVIDLVSTGATWKSLSVERDFFCLIFQDMNGYVNPPDLNENFSYWFKASDLGGTTFLWEILNCADHGMLMSVNDFNLNWFEYANHELPTEFVSTMKSFYSRVNQILDNYEISSINQNPTDVFKFCHDLLKDRSEEYEQMFRPLFDGEIRNVERLKSVSQIL